MFAISSISSAAGSGVSHHPESVERFPKELRRTAITLENVPSERMTDENFLFMLLRLQTAFGPESRPEMVSSEH